MENAMAWRTEHDSIGDGLVPADAYYGIQTLRAVENFRITGQRPHPELVRSLALVKQAAAMANEQAGVLPGRLAAAIVEACMEIRDGALADQFVVDPIQGGAGTSLNMNANEVIANRALELLGADKGNYALLHPNDHVNASQSTNDVIPTAGRMTALMLLPALDRELARLMDALGEKARVFDDVVKMARTQLQDAVPIRLGQSFAAHATAVSRARGRIAATKAELMPVNLGGTAVGNGVNAPAAYRNQVVDTLRSITGLDLIAATDGLDATQHLDSIVALSGALKACAVVLSKIANDLRLLSSGPRAGLGEINLPARQNGSSIMPGKVNPVIPEVVNQVAFNIIGNDMTITMAAEAGQLELNAFEPIVFYCLFQSIDAMTHALATFVDRCVTGITANEAHCRRQVTESVGVATALCPRIGYGRAADLAKEALRTGRPVAELVTEVGLMPPDEVARVLDPRRLSGLPA